MIPESWLPSLPFVVVLAGVLIMIVAVATVNRVDRSWFRHTWTCTRPRCRRRWRGRDKMCTCGHRGVRRSPPPEQLDTEPLKVVPPPNPHFQSEPK